MPLYASKCQHDHETTFFAHVDERDDPRQCPACGANTYRVLAAPTVHAGFAPYRSPVTGQWIDSPTQRREDLKRSGSIEWEPGIRQDLPRKREEAMNKAFAPLEATIEKTARDLVNSGQMSPL